MARLTTGIAYIRTTRGAYPVIYDNAEAFPVGGAKVLRHSDHDVATLVAAGVTVHTCLDAADRLARSGVHVRVIDAWVDATLAGVGADPDAPAVVASAVDALLGVRL